MDSHIQSPFAILQIIQCTQFRGAEMFACQLSNHLEQKGHAVVMVALADGGVTLPFVGELRILQASLGKRFLDLKGWKQLAQIIRTGKPDIIQANAGDTLKYAVFSKRVFGWEQPIVFRNANKMSDFIDGKAKFYFNRWLLGHTSHIVSVSEECKKDIIDTFHLPPAKVTTATIGIETPIIDDLPGDVQEIFSRGPVLLHVGSFVPEKNHSGLLEIFQELTETIPNAQLVLVGKGKLEEDTKSRAKTLASRNQIHLLGARQDVPSIMKASSALLMPSWIEGLPGVILEAMYAGLPVVAYDVGGIGEVIKEKETGRLIEKGNSRQFVQATLETLQNANMKESITGKAHQLVLAQYRNEEIAGQFEAIYQKVLSHQ